MGWFAFYNGMIYNEFFAIPLEIYGSCYSEEIEVVTNQKVSDDVYEPLAYGYKKASDNCVYTFGMDPRWV